MDSLIINVTSQQRTQFSLSKEKQKPGVTIRKQLDFHTTSDLYSCQYKSINCIVTKKEKKNPNLPLKCALRLEVVITAVITMKLQLGRYCAKLVILLESVHPCPFQALSRCVEHFKYYQFPHSVSMCLINKKVNCRYLLGKKKFICRASKPVSLKKPKFALKQKLLYLRLFIKLGFLSQS